MPIIELPNSDEPLSQGDLLRDVKLFATSGIDRLPGGESELTKFNLCLVLSRPCAITHKPSIIVACVDKYHESIPREASTFQKAKYYLENLRDGDESPELFYLGQLPIDTVSGRFVARLDSIHTIKLSAKPEVRAEFIKKHRCARLCIDFRRDLHTRIFQSFSIQGFEDYGWYSDADLVQIIKIGNSEIAKHKVDIDSLKTAQQAEGNKDKAILEIESKIKEIEKQMNGHITECIRRNIDPK